MRWLAVALLSFSALCPWYQHDRAVYAVSTLNVVHCPGGWWLPQRLEQMGVDHYEVYASADADVYFVLAGRFEYVYRFGTRRPRALEHAPCAKPAWPRLITLSRLPLRLIAVFSSTLPLVWRPHVS